MNGKRWVSILLILMLVLSTPASYARSEQPPAEMQPLEQESEEISEDVISAPFSAEEKPVTSEEELELTPEAEVMEEVEEEDHAVSEGFALSDVPQATSEDVGTEETLEAVDSSEEAPEAASEEEVNEVTDVKQEEVEGTQEEVVTPEPETTLEEEVTPTDSVDEVVEEVNEEETLTEPEVATEGEAPQTAPETDIAEPVETDVAEMEPLGTRGVSVSDFTVTQVEPVAYTGQQITLRVDINITEASYDLAGSTIKISIPNVSLDQTAATDKGLKGGDIPGATHKVENVGDNRVLTYTFSELPVSAMHFSVYVTSADFLTPSQFGIPVKAELTTTEGDTFQDTSNLTIIHKVVPPKISEYLINGRKDLNALFFGGLAHPTYSGYISEDGASTLISYYKIIAKDTAAQDGHGGRDYEKRVIQVTLPTYVDYKGDTRTAVVDLDETPGWVVSADGKTATKEDTSTFLMRSNNEYTDDKNMLAIKMPGAKADDTTQYTQKISVTYYPRNASSYELANLVTAEETQTFRLSKAVTATVLTKRPVNKTIVDQLYMKQQPNIWQLSFHNKDTTYSLKDVVLLDDGLSSELKYHRISVYTNKNQFVNGSNPGSVSIIATTPGGDVTVDPNYSVGTARENYVDLPEGTTSVKIVATEGSLLKPGGYLYGNLDTRFIDPVNTVYQPKVTEKFSNKLTADGVYTDGDAINIPAPENKVTAEQSFVIYEPRIYVAKSNSPAKVMIGESVLYVLDVRTSGSHKILPPDRIHDPVIVDLLPKGMVFDADSLPIISNQSGVPENASVFNKMPELVENYQNTGRTALIWRGTKPIEGTLRDNYFQLQFKAIATVNMMEGVNSNEVYFGWSNNKPTVPSDIQQVGVYVIASSTATDDIYGIGGGGKVSRAQSNFTLDPPGILVPSKQTKGDLNSVEVNRGHVELGGTAEFVLREYNGNDTHPVVNMRIMDILPRNGVAGSQYTPVLSGPAVAPAGYTVEYATGTPEATVAWLLNDANWGAAPGDLSTVTAIRFSMNEGTELPKKGKHEFTVPVRVPISAASQGGMTAHNRMYTYLPNSSELLVSESYLDTYTYSVRGKAFVDANLDGFYEEGETLLSNVTVHLLDSDGNPVAGANGAAITTLTDVNGAYQLFTSRPGSYKVAFDYDDSLVPTAVPEGAVSKSNANHATGTASPSMTEAFDLVFKPGVYTVRNAGFFQHSYDVKATKVWAGLAEGYTDTPQVSFQLQRSLDGGAVENVGSPVVVGSTNSVTWKNQPAHLNLKPYTYSVVESSVPNGYKVTYSGAGPEGFVVTNTYDGTTDNTTDPVTVVTTVIASKVWANIPTGTTSFPKASLTLMRNGTAYTAAGVTNPKEVTAVGNGTQEVKWENLLTFAPNGSKYVYTVEELKTPNGYKKTVSSDGLTFTNTYDGISTDNDDTAGKLTVDIEKVWKTPSQDDYKPTSASFTLMRNDGEEMAQATANFGNSWKVSIGNLYRYAPDGSAYTYSVTEDPVPNGYSVQVSGNQNDGFTVTNTYHGDKTIESLEGKKSWAGLKEGDPLPESVRIFLERKPIGSNDYSYEEVPGTSIEIKLTGANGTHEGFTHTFTGPFEKYATDGTLYVYRLAEDTLGAYIGEYSDENNLLHLTNVYDTLTTGFAMFKDYHDLPDGFAVEDLPETITLQLMQQINSGTYSEPILSDPEAYGEPLVVSREEFFVENEEGQLEYEAFYTRWEDLPIMTTSDHFYEYSVIEDPVPNGYEVTSGFVGGSEILVYQVTNTYTGGERAITVTKQWTDLPSGSSGPSVKVQLYREGVAIGDPVTLSDGGDHEAEHTWNNLLRYKTDGTEYIYTVDEVSVPNGYNKTVTGNPSDGFKITNAYTGGEDTTTFTGSKVWANIPEGTTSFPSASITLMQNGTAYSAEGVTNPIVVTATGNGAQAVRWEDLPTFAPDSSRYVYTMEELTVPDGYKKTVSADKLTVTNTYTGLGSDGEGRTFTGSKVWANIPEGTTSFPSASITLMQNGTAYEEAGFTNPIEVTATGNGTQTVQWENLPIFAPDSSRYVYTIDELTVPDGYKKTVSEDKLSVTNTFTQPEPEEDVVGRKVWVNGPKPEVAFELWRKNGTAGAGEKVSGPTAVDSSTNQVNFGKQPKTDVNGVEYEYYVLEPEVPANYTKAEDGLTVTNTYVIPTNATATATKVWVSGTAPRPTVWFKLYRQVEGGALEEVPEAQAPIKELADGTTTAEWTGLEATDSSGKLYTFSVKEVDAAGSDFEPENYQKLEEGLQVTNTYIGTSSILLEKSADVTVVEKVGDKIVYTIKVTNTGKETLQIVRLEDKMFPGLALGEKQLAPGASAEVQVSYTVTDKDLLSETIVNTARVIAKNPLGEEVVGEGKASVDVKAKEPNYSLILRKRLYDADGKAIEETKNFEILLVGPSYPSGRRMSIHTYEDTLVDNLQPGTYHVEQINGADYGAYTISIGPAVTLSRTNQQGMILVEGRLQKQADPKPKLPETGSRSPLVGYILGLSALLLGAMLLKKKRAC